MVAEDRIQSLQDQSRVTGIDFVYVHPDQVNLDIYFLRSPASLDQPLVGDLLLEDVRIYRQEDEAEVPLESINWTLIDGQDVLQILTAHPGDFSLYTLAIEGDKDINSLIDPPRIDPYFNHLSFSFKASCPSDLDCKPLPHDCPPEDQVDFPINYQARDFWSYRQALLDFASERYPDWQDRLEADAGMMLTEVMSALADESAYFQDRVSREGYLATATQRRSVKHHARLVDYEMHDGAAAQAWLNIQVTADGVLPAGTDVWAAGDNGLRVDFELGRGLHEIATAHEAGVDYELLVARNSLLPHCWDEDDICLKVGTTELYLQGEHEADLLPFVDENEAGELGRWVLLATYPAPGLPARRHYVRVVEVENQQDPVFGVPITYIRWEAEQALPFELDMTVLQLHANIVPATAGRTYTAYFVVGQEADELNVSSVLETQIKRAVEREGANQTPVYLYSIPASDENPLVWLGEDTQNLRPEVRLTEVDTLTEIEIPQGDWTWRRALVGPYSSQEQDHDFTLENGSWKRIVGYQRIGEEIVHQDYANGAGHSIRFGDGEFGAVPAEGTLFRLDYRLGNGKRTNVAAGTLSHFTDPGGIVESIDNPLSASWGVDEEPLTQVRQLAPEAFRALTFRAVRPEDYAEAAERLDWVQRAGASFRWTGSWLTAFVTPDPLGASSLSQTRKTALGQQLDRFRQAGRPVSVMDPVYANMDIEITICAKSFAYAGEVKAAVLAVLTGSQGFFSPDNFTFGTPLRRSKLEAVIQSSVPGVQAVEAIRFRRRGWFNWRSFSSMVYSPGQNTILRLENDPRLPEQGSLKLIINGGA